MKLSYSVIISMCALKLAVTKPVDDSNSLHTSTAAEQLVKYYDHEYDLWVQEICLKIINITDDILKDEIVQKPVTPLTQALQKNLTEFQQNYPYLKRFGFDASLVSEFSDMLQGFYYPSPNENNTDFAHIQQLLRKFGYNEIRMKYKDKLKKFVDEKFLKKFEDSKAEVLSESKSRKQDLIILQWINFLKDCQEYECLIINFRNYERKRAQWLDRFFGELFRDIFIVLAKNAENTTIFAQAVLKDAKLLQLSEPLQQQLIKNLQGIIKIQENLSTPEQVLYFHGVSYYILYKFADYASITPQDRKLITNIFDDHEYGSLLLEGEKNQLVNIDYIKQYENKEAALSPKELAVLKGIQEAIERLVNASNSQEMAEAWKRLQKVSSDQTKS